MESFNTKRQWIIITLEIVSRELTEKLIIADKAIEKEWGIIFGGRAELLRYMKYLPKAIFFVKSASKIDYPYIKAAKNYGQKVVCLDAEGLVQHNYDYFAETRVDKSVLNIIDLYFTWGKKQADVIKNKYPNMKDKIKITGSPKVEIWKGNYSTTNNNNIESLIGEYGQFIAIPTSFGEYNHKLGYQTGLKMEIGSYQLRDSYLKKKMEYYNYIEKIFNKYLEFVPLLSKQLPNTNILIKVHPSENKKPWENIKNKYPNVSIFDGNISELLKAAHIIIQTESTTAIEAYIYNKIVFSYCPVTDKEMINQSLVLPRMCSIMKKNTDNLISEIRNISNSLYDSSKYYNKQKIDNSLTKRMMNFSKNNSSKEIIDNFENLNVNKYENKLLNDNNLESSHFLFSFLSIFRNRKFLWKILPHFIKWRVQCNIIVYGSFKFQIYKLLFNVREKNILTFLITNKLNKKIDHHIKSLDYGAGKRKGFNRDNILNHYNNLFPNKNLNNIIIDDVSKEIVVLYAS